MECGIMVEYIWNGVGLTTPDAWEPSALERDGFLLEDQGQPVCELKWSTVQGSFNFKKHIKRLVKEHKGVDMQGVSEAETPNVWAKAVARLSESGIILHSFVWKTQVHRGLGAVMHNPATGLAALVQFFITSPADEVVAAETLSTLRDYSGGKSVPWAMFGLSGRLPAAFKLETFSFRPGHYTIKFWRAKSAKQAGKLPAGKGPGTSLVFQRFAPASVLLKGTELDQWLRDMLDPTPHESVPMESSEAGVAWAGIATKSMLRSLLRREVHVKGQAWRTDTGNAILVVTATGNIPVTGEAFNDMCESYEFV